MTNIQQITPPENRKSYIDVLRGILILLVVIQHQDTFIFINSELGINSILVSIRMPLFFFISGFLLHSPDFLNNFQNRFFNRVICQLYPTILIFIIYNIFVANQPLSESIQDPSKNGYWFTYVIFIHFCAYSIIMYVLSSHINSVQRIIFFALITLIALVLFLRTSNINEFILGEGNHHDIFSIYLFSKHLPPFLLGALTKQHFNSIMRRINSLTLVFCFVFAVYMVYFSNALLYYYIGKLLMTVTIFMIFSYCSRYISYNGILKRHFVWLGKSTLQIYLLHYFFIAFLCYVIPTEFAEILSHNHYIYFISVLVLALGCTYGCMGVVYLLKKIGLYSYIFPRRNLYRDIIAKRMSRSSAI